MTQQTNRIRVHRHHGGAPLIRPTDNAWENGVTFNAAVVYLGNVAHDRPTIHQLLRAAGADVERGSDGLVVVHYRARPRHDTGFHMNRSYIGLALFDPDLNLIHRFPEPVLTPDADPDAADYLGVEDPRVTRIGEQFVMVYCGCGRGLNEGEAWRATLCTAESCDLLNWQKHGAIDLRTRFGDGHVNNKDGVLFQDSHDGWSHLLHRPMVGPISQWSIHLARSRSPHGPWEDLGPIMRALREPNWTDTWIGAGTVPIALGEGRYLEIHHSGHRAEDGSRLYTLGAAVLNLNKLDPERPGRIVESRLDHFMVPETPWEIEGPYPDSVGNVLFACGAYERNDELHILYGGGDTYVMAASVSKAELLSAMHST